MEFKVEIEGDSEGYIAFECPYCKSEFKLNAGEYKDCSEQEKIFCPYCGLEIEKESFYTPEVIEQATNMAKNYMLEEINKAFGKMSKEINKSKVVKMEFKPLKKVNVSNIKTEDTVEEQFQCKNCKKHVKVLYCSGKSKVFCSYCGEDI